MNNIQLNHDQELAFKKLKKFIDDDNQQVFILTGYAGTGKTTLMNMLADELDRRRESFSLMATTGRAAKILSDATGRPARTVHSTIYSFRGFNRNLESVSRDIKMEKSGQLLIDFEAVTLDEDMGRGHIYIIDESSMMSDVKEKDPTQATFGTGKLLNDLFAFNVWGKFIFIGDTAQLAPFTSSFSPALSPDYIRDTYDKQVIHAELRQIMRQENGNDLIQAASKIRNMVTQPAGLRGKWTFFPLRGFRNITIHPNDINLMNSYIRDIKQNGFAHATLIASTNKQCTECAEIVRPALGFTEKRVCVGDLLLITQNNLISGLYNGDQVVVKSIGARELRAQLTFVHVEVEELLSKKRYSQLMIEDILYGSACNLTQKQQQALFIDFYYRMEDKGIGQKDKEFNSRMFTDEYLNALRAVYGYVLTCHKGQGGEWPHVYVSIPRSISFQTDAPKCQWLYTAMTRAKQQLHIADGFYLR